MGPAGGKPLGKKFYLWKISLKMFWCLSQKLTRKLQTTITCTAPFSGDDFMGFDVARGLIRLL